MRLGSPNCGGSFCYPWAGPYADPSKGRTLLVASMGPHYSDPSQFRTDLDAFLRTIDGAGRRDDMVWFRTNVPGHEGCDSPAANSPFPSYSEYAPTSSIRFSWDKFDDFNDEVDRALERRRRTRQVGPSAGDGEGRTAGGAMPEVDLLDVFPFTVLRRDGHLAGADCNKCGVDECPKCKDDCLHYSLPGPVDWWTHLLYSQLVDIASATGVSGR